MLSEPPDLIINILDASNIERNLYLTTQLMELKIPIIGVLNMMDIVEKKGLKLDLQSLEGLWVPIYGDIRPKGNRY